MFENGVVVQNVILCTCRQDDSLVKQKSHQRFLASLLCLTAVNTTSSPTPSERPVEATALNFSDIITKMTVGSGTNWDGEAIRAGIGKWQAQVREVREITPSVIGARL